MPILPQTDTDEKPDPFLTPTAPPWAARTLAAVLIVLFGAALIAAIVVRVPETVSAPFVLVPVGGADPVRAPRAGSVAAIQIREGQSVRLGEPALVLRASSVGAGWAEVEGLERAAVGAHERRGVAALRRELDGSRGNEQTVAIPCAGTVVRLGVRAPGAVVQEGELLAEVACGDAQMLAELALPSRGVSRLRPGLGAKLFYDALPYQRHGARPGTVQWVSPASVSLGGSAAFRAHVTPADLAIRVDGHSRPLLAGMTGRAEIVVGRHALITYAFEPLRQLRENLAPPPSPDARALAIRAEARPPRLEPGPAAT